MKKKMLLTCVVVLLSAILLCESTVFAVFTSTDSNKNSNYSRNAALKYAVDYLYSTNPPSPYVYYDSDCTNYVSQILKAGGMSMTSAVASPSQASWYFYYDTVGLGRSPGFTGLHEFRYHWADVNNVGNKRAYSFVKYNARDIASNNTL